jgi:FkbM family methyltransferase
VSGGWGRHLAPVRRALARVIATPWMTLRLVRKAPDRRSALTNIRTVHSMWWARRTGTTPRERTVTVSKDSAPVSLRVGDLSEVQVVDEIFVNDVYAEIAALQAPRTILDLGSNMGASLSYFATRWAGAEVYGFEPNPQVFERLRRNVAPFPNVSVAAYAVGASDGTAALRVRAHETWTGTLHSDGEGTATEVAVRSLDSILAELSLTRVDLLKIDIEGSEFDVFDSFRGLPRIQAVVGEVHAPQGSGLARRFLDHLSGFSISVSPSSEGSTFGIFAVRGTQPRRSSRAQKLGELPG